MQLELRKTIISSENKQSQIILFEAFIASKVIATLTSVEDLFFKACLFWLTEKIGRCCYKPHSDLRTFCTTRPPTGPYILPSLYAEISSGSVQVQEHL